MSGVPGAGTVAMRTATAADLPTVLGLLALLDAAGTPPLPLVEAERVFARMATYPDYAVWLAEEDGAAVGTYSLLLMDNLGHRGAPEGVVENVAVAERARGRGIGRAMMEHAMATCRARGCYKLVLSSNVARRDAHRFYESLGWRKHGYSFRVDL